MKITENLAAHGDEKYARFQSTLTPGVPLEKFIGVKVPIVRQIAKEYAKNPECRDFLNELPHEYYDENMLHGLLIAQCKDYDECMKLLEEFLPYIDNWAVCDCLCPKVFAKHKEELICKIREWTLSNHVYTCRFGIRMLMNHFLEDDFSPEYLQIPAEIKSDEYYVNMMIAWFFATALCKQWDEVILYLENHTLSPWIHNKTIQKARESYRITGEQKEYLKTLKVKI